MMTTLPGLDTLSEATDAPLPDAGTEWRYQGRIVRSLGRLRYEGRHGVLMVLCTWSDPLRTSTEQPRTFLPVAELASLS